LPYLDAGATCRLQNDCSGGMACVSSVEEGKEGERVCVSSQDKIKSVLRWNGPWASQSWPRTTPTLPALHSRFFRNNAPLYNSINITMLNLLPWKSTMNLKEIIYNLISLSTILVHVERSSCQMGFDWSFFSFPTRANFFNLAWAITTKANRCLPNRLDSIRFPYQLSRYDVSSKLACRIE
jgi:hypothetical protein